MLLMGVSLQISDYEILKDAGKISHEIAQEKALDEYEKFRLIQDRDFLSDFFVPCCLCQYHSILFSGCHYTCGIIRQSSALYQ